MRCNHFIPYSLSYIFLPAFHFSLFSIVLSLSFFIFSSPSKYEGERNRVRRWRKIRREEDRNKEAKEMKEKSCILSLRKSLYYSFLFLSCTTERKRGKKSREREWGRKERKRKKKEERTISCFQATKIHFHPNYRLISSPILSLFLSLSSSLTLIFRKGEKETGCLFFFPVFNCNNWLMLIKQLSLSITFSLSLTLSSTFSLTWFFWKRKSKERGEEKRDHQKIIIDFFS